MSAEVDAYLVALPASQRAALQDLRAAARAYLPDALKRISCVMPGFHQPGLKGKMILGYAAFVRHPGVNPHSGTTFLKLPFHCKGL